MDRFVLSERQAAASLAPFSSDITFPDVEQARTDFDRVLLAEPEKVDPERRELMVALGLVR